MAKISTQGFILTLLINTERWQEDIISKKFEMYRTMYNCCIGELYKRYNHMLELKIVEEIFNIQVY